MALKSRSDEFKKIEDIKDIFCDELDKISKSDNSQGSGNSSSSGHSNSRPANTSNDYLAVFPTTNNESNTNQNNNSDKEDNSAAEQFIYKDTNNVDWAYQAIQRLTQKGIVSGDGDGYFRPNSEVKREEFLKMVIEALNLKNVDENITFKDVDENAWYYKYICGGIYYELINGMDNNIFGVGKNIKRADVAVILVRILKMYGKEYSKKEIVYRDVLKSEIEYAYDAIYTVSEAKLMNGTSNVTFEPDRSLTRAESAVVIDRLITLLENNWLEVL